MFKALRVAFFLAPKAVVRGNLGISLLTICMLAIVAMNLLFVPGLINGIVNSSNKILVETYSSDLIVESQKDNPYISHIRDLVSDIETVDGVVAVSARNSIGAKIEYNEEKVSCSIVAINPEKDKKVFDIPKYLIEGEFLDPRDRDQIVLGVQIAGADLKNIELYSSSLRNVHANDKVNVIYANGIQKKYTVKGIFYSKFIQTDIQAFITDLEYLYFVPEAKDKATSIRIKIDSNADPAAVIANISSLQDGLKFKTWVETAGIIQSMTDSFQLIKQILDIVNILVAGITVFIVTYVDVVNRRRQIGIQRAIGIKPYAITISYIIRAFFYATLGLIAGIILYRYIVIPLENQHPFTFPIGPAYLSMETYLVVRTIVILLLVSLFASFIPVWRVMRKSILDAIWG
jgi:putative ABC transport system permease protein